MTTRNRTDLVIHAGAPPQSAKHRRARDQRKAVVRPRLRARTSAALYTDSRADLLAALGARDSTQVGALDEPLTRYGPGTVLDGPGPEMA